MSAEWYEPLRDLVALIFAVILLGQLAQIIGEMRAARSEAVLFRRAVEAVSVRVDFPTMSLPSYGSKLGQGAIARGVADGLARHVERERAREWSIELSRERAEEEPIEGHD